MKYVIKILCLADGTPTPSDNTYVKSFDPDGFNGRGQLTTTPDVGRAKQFSTQVEALRFWQQQSKVNPTRPDGQPNRPLTAYSVTIDPV